MHSEGFWVLSSFMIPKNFCYCHILPYQMIFQNIIGQLLPQFEEWHEMKKFLNLKPALQKPKIRVWVPGPSLEMMPPPLYSIPQKIFLIVRKNKTMPCIQANAVTSLLPLRAVKNFSCYHKSNVIIAFRPCIFSLFYGGRPLVK